MPENTVKLWNVPMQAKINLGALYEGGTGMNDCIIFFGQDGPSQYDTSFMKTFVNVAGRFTRARSWRDEHTTSDKHNASSLQKIKLTWPATGVKLTTTSGR